MLYYLNADTQIAALRFNQISSVSERASPLSYFFLGKKKIAAKAGSQKDILHTHVRTHTHPHTHTHTVQTHKLL